MDQNTEREFDWNDEIEKDGGDFILLKPGDYDFTITNFERGRYDGGDKLPPCNMAIVHCQIETPEGSTTIQNRLFLHSKTEGILSAFFSSIGLKKKGEKLKMDWNKVIGSKGRCKVDLRNWTNDSGEVKQSNDIKRFHPKEDNLATGYIPGKF